MEGIHRLAELNQKRAWKIIEDTDIIAIWQSIGAEINLVGSLKSGLLMKNRDIDFHIYSDPVILSDSFRAISILATNPGITRIEYVNLLQTEEACIEWHVWYEDKDGDTWKFDLIHIQKGSAYDGYMEKVTSRIIELLTPEIRDAVLQIKYDIPETEKVMGIEIYRAVLEAGIRDYNQFQEWRKKNPVIGVLKWMP